MDAENIFPTPGWIGPASPDAGIELLRQLFLQCTHRQNVHFSTLARNYSQPYKVYNSICYITWTAPTLPPRAWLRQRVTPPTRFFWHHGFPTPQPPPPTPSPSPIVSHLQKGWKTKNGKLGKGRGVWCQKSNWEYLCFVDLRELKHLLYWFVSQIYIVFLSVLAVILQSLFLGARLGVLASVWEAPFFQ